jgi:hypothetical protein
MVLTKTYRFLLLLFIGLSLIAAPLTAHSEETAAKSTGKSFLWEVKSPTNVVYILGSIHLLKQQNYPLNPTIEGAFDKVKSLVFEISMDTKQLEQTQKMMVERSTFAGDKTLKGSISETAYQAVSKKVAELGMNMDMFNKFKPWSVAVTIAAMKFQSMGFDPNYGVDLHFVKKAQEAKKKILSLETMEYQIELFDTLSAEMQEQMLQQTLADLDVLQTEMPLIVRNWETGNVSGMEELFMKSFKPYPEIYKKLIVDRNKAWTTKIKGYLKDGDNYLVVVGAGHLVGKDGVIELLKKEGFSATQL